MKETICNSVIGICIFLLIGIVGNVECGASEWQLLWGFPLFAVMGFCAYILHVENERELRRYDAWKARKMRNDNERI
jgi:hypothetical protein